MGGTLLPPQRWRLKESESRETVSWQQSFHCPPCMGVCDATTPGGTGAPASGLTRSWEWAGGPAREAGTSQPQVPTCQEAGASMLPPPNQGVWAGETVVLAAPSSCHRERKHQAQVHSRCSVRGKSSPLWMPEEPESPGEGWALDSGCWKDINVQPFLTRGAVTLLRVPSHPSLHPPLPRSTKLNAHLKLSLNQEGLIKNGYLKNNLQIQT